MDGNVRYTKVAKSKMGIWRRGRSGGREEREPMRGCNQRENLKPKNGQKRTLRSGSYSTPFSCICRMRSRASSLTTSWSFSEAFKVSNAKFIPLNQSPAKNTQSQKRP